MKGMTMTGKPSKRVNLRGSALFKLTSPVRLAQILCIPPAQLDRLLRRGNTNYCVRTDRKTERLIEEPKALLKQIHARVAHLLGQIETPAYLHSGIKKHSYLTNAAAHRVDGGAIKLDVQKFFPSVRAAAVCHFFSDTMEYPMDVASRMTKLLTIDGHLPTGGNASCILSYWAYKDMFDEIAGLADARGCTFTLYVDDVTITGQFASRDMQKEARAIIGRYRLKAHKAKIFSQRQPRVVTGVAVTARGPELPNRRAKKIASALTEVTAAQTDKQRLALMPSLIGRVSEAAVVDPAWTGRKMAAVKLRRTISARAAGSTETGS